MRRSLLWLAMAGLLIPVAVGFGPARTGTPTVADAQALAGDLAGEADLVNGVVVAGPGGFVAPGTYTTPVTVVTTGGSVTLHHADAARHDVVADDLDENGKPLFQSALIGLGESADVVGVPDLPPGQYGFYCSLHPWMQGELVVTDAPGGSEPDPDPPPVAQDWRLDGGDLANSRHRPDAGPSPDDVVNLTAAWTYETVDEGDFPGTPILTADRLFLGTSQGHAIALDAGTGAELWTADLNTGDQTAAITASGAYHEGVVYFPVTARTDSEHTPYVIALDAITGQELWRTPTDPDQPLGELSGSPTIWSAHQQLSDGTVVPFDYLFVGTSSADPDAGHIGSVLALDLNAGGTAVWRTPIADVTTTPAIDAATSTIYVATRSGNADLSSSVVALDAFDGSFVASYTVAGGFETAPQLVEGPDSQPWVGAGTGNGQYHMLDRATLTPAWVANPPTGAAAGGFLGSTAHDGGLLVGTLDSGQQVALSEADGSVAWTAPTVDAPNTHHAPTTIANGVAYTVDAKGLLHAWDAATGVERWVGQVGQGPTSGGISVAGDTVFVARGLDTASGSITAFRLP